MAAVGDDLRADLHQLTMPFTPSVERSSHNSPLIKSRTSRLDTLCCVSLSLSNAPQYVEVRKQRRDFVNGLIRSEAVGVESDRRPGSMSGLSRPGPDSAFAPICTITASLRRRGTARAQVRHHFNQERHLVTRSVYKQRRSAALTEWLALAA